MQQTPAAVREAAVREGEGRTLSSPQPSRKKRGFRRKEEICGTAFAAIPLLGFLLFSAVPVCIAIVTMFCDMNGMNIATLRWNSFANFGKAFTDLSFWKSFLVSLEMTLSHIVGLVISIVIAAVLSQKIKGGKLFTIFFFIPYVCFIAAVLSQKIKGGKLFTIFFFIPYVCSSAAISIMWVQIFKPTGGLINSVLTSLGVADPPDWFRDSRWFPWMLVITIAWKAPGYGILMVQAALANVNPALYEAAKLDGASRFRQFMSITFPAISPTLYFLLSMGLLNGLQTFDIAQIFAQKTSGYVTGAAGPGDAGLTTVFHIYNTMNNPGAGGMPVASILSLLLFAAITLVLALNKKLSRLWVSYDY